MYESRRNFRRLALPTIALVLSQAALSIAAENEDLAFFESKIRPVLVEKCYSCHSADAKAVKGGLLLDTKEGLLKGGDSGPALVPGKPELSLLVEALKYEGFEMPPSGKLPATVVADFEQWVKRGAPDPRVGKSVAQKRTIDLEAGRKFWSFRPIGEPRVPQVRDQAWPTTDIDRFILAALEGKNLNPATDAEARALVRRLYFDLIGLPPTAEEVEEFFRGDMTYPQLVDKLLASPHFGERWGRHWLDVARFAESSGGGRSMVFKEAWRYRDYVIDSFNADKPLDQFIVEQIAGDLLPHSGDDELRDHLTATAYLVLGAINYEEQDKKVLEMDVADEQIEAVGKGLLGMTIGCARCHDHKFDPIPTSDYYALAGIFRSTEMLVHDNVSRWTERPLPMNPEQAAAIVKHEAEVAALKQKLDAAKALVKRLQPQGALATAPIDAESLAGIVVDDAQIKRVGEWTHSTHVKNYVGVGYLTDDNEGKGEKTLTFQPEFKKAGLYEVRLGYPPSINRAESVPVSLLTVDGEIDRTVNLRETPPIDGRFLSLGTFRFDTTNQWFVMVSNEGTRGYVTIDCVQFLPVDEATTAPATTATATGKPADPKNEKKLATDDPASKAAAEAAALEKQMKQLQASGPPRPMTMACDDAEKIEDCALCIRGNVHNRGAVVPRGVLQVATVGAPPVMPKKQSGRLELARWIASDANPLTARVYVNRVWHYLFGAGLVRTVDNFGTTGETPSHPELLDYLARRFTAEGWSTKRLVREIVLSHAYRMSTAPNPAAAKIDPENRLLWRMNRRRLDAESIRDAVLTVSGKLDRRVGGITVDDPDVLKGVGTVTPTEYTFVFTDVRRSVYTPAFRNRMLELFEAFDFADPNSVAGKRNVSTVAPQALYLLNSPFMMDQARFAAEKLLAEDAADDAARVDRAFRAALSRPPTERERAAALAAVTVAESPELKTYAEAKLAAYERLYQALFGCIDFRYLE